MSFEKLTQEEMREVAEWFAVDLDTSVNAKGNLNPKLVAAAFAEEGVTFDMYLGMKAQRDAAVAELEAEKAREEANLANVITESDLDEDLEPVEDSVVVPKRRQRRPAEVLVKMERQNPHYEIQGKVFTREHPFLVMSEDQAQAIFDSDWGFRMATPREAAEYYS